MDRFDAMRAFARVVEAGSFTKAAKTLHMSRTTVTQLVQQLEARLRVRLLNPTTRKLSVTADGAIYYERVIRLLSDLDDAETSLPSASPLPKGRLRIDVPSPLARMLLVPALPAFHARYPGIQLNMGVSDRMVDLVGKNVDCVIRGGHPSEQFLQGRHVGALAAGLHGQTVSAKRRTSATVRKLVHRPDADVRVISPKPICEPEAASIHRLGDRIDGTTRTYGQSQPCRAISAQVSSESEWQCREASFDHLNELASHPNCKVARATQAPAQHQT